MKCKKMRLAAAAMKPDEFTPQMREHVDACAGCAAFVQRDLAVRRLVSLKQFEKPDEGFAARNLRAVRVAIAEQDTAPARVPAWQGFLDGALPATRYALAAAVLIVAGFQMLMGPSLSMVQSQLPESLPVRFAAAQPPALPVEKPIIFVASPTPPPSVVLLASTQQPSRMEYGGGVMPSRLAGFDF